MLQRVNARLQFRKPSAPQTAIGPNVESTDRVKGNRGWGGYGAQVYISLLSLPCPLITSERVLTRSYHREALSGSQRSLGPDMHSQDRLAEAH